MREKARYSDDGLFGGLRGLLGPATNSPVWIDEFVGLVLGGSVVLGVEIDRAKTTVEKVNPAMRKRRKTVHFVRNGPFFHQFHAIVDPFVVKTVEIIAVVAREFVCQSVEKKIADEEIIDSGVVQQFHFEQHRIVAFALFLMASPRIQTVSKRSSSPSR